MTSLNEETIAKARATRVLAAITKTLDGTGFVLLPTRRLTVAMLPTLERLAVLAQSYRDNLSTREAAWDVAAMLDEVGLVFERPPVSRDEQSVLDSLQALFAGDEVPSRTNAGLGESAKITLERARESCAALEQEVDTLTDQLAESERRLDARLDVMLTGPCPESWGGVEAFELQVLLLLELRFAKTVGFEPNTAWLLQERYSAFRRSSFPAYGGNLPLSEMTSDHGFVCKVLCAFRKTLAAAR
jgi:hypothetical protein